MNPSDKDRAEAIKLVNDWPRDRGSILTTPDGDWLRNAIATALASARTAPPEPTMWWDDNGEEALSSPEEYPPWCELKHGDVVQFSCARSCPREWYKRVDHADDDDFDIVKLTPEEEAVQIEKERQELRRRKEEMDRENAARKSALSSHQTQAEKK